MVNQLSYQQRLNTLHDCAKEHVDFLLRREGVIPSPNERESLIENHFNRLKAQFTKSGFLK